MPHTARLLPELIAENPFQPATSWWRAVELAAVLRHGLPAGSGLDLGCGDGKLMRILLQAATKPTSLVGVDPDPLEASDAQASGVYRRVHVAPGDRVPEPEASFDFVFSNSVLEHIAELDPVIAEVARLLRRGGTFLFTVPGSGFHDCLAGPLLPGRGRERYLEHIDRRCAHVRYWNEAQWREALAAHGLEVVGVVPYLSAAQTRRWETLSRFTAGVLYTLAGERRQPIEIQRGLNLRRRGLRLPRWAAVVLARAIATRAGDDAAGGFACLLVDARRR